MLQNRCASKALNPILNPYSSIASRAALLRRGLELSDGLVELAHFHLQRLDVLHGFVEHVGRVGGLLHVRHQVLQLLHALADAGSAHALRDAARVRCAAALRPGSHLHVVAVIEDRRRGCWGGQARVPDEAVLGDAVEPE